MKLRVIVIVAVLAAFAAAAEHARAQEHKSIHEMESERHHWDAVRLDPRVPEFARGKDAAIDGRYKQAIAAFTRGAKKNRAAAEFNIGLVYFYQNKFSAALRQFQRSNRIRHDSVTQEYLQTSKRLVSERSKQRKK